jgi:pentatricopeptide repeat protein
VIMLGSLTDEDMPVDQSRRTVRYFVSYAHNDKELAADLLRRLKPRLKTRTAYEFQDWQDSDIPLGSDWHEQIQQAVRECDFGLLLVSPDFLASSYISKNELPHFVLPDGKTTETVKRVVPVALKAVLDDSVDLRGLQHRQIFLDSGGKAYAERARRRDAFVDELVAKIIQLLQTNQPPEPSLATKAPSADEPVADVAPDMSMKNTGAQEVLLEKVPAKPAEIAAQHRGGPCETKPSIAVLPFQNMSGDPTQEYFADGMVDEITTALSRVRWLHVVSRSSSFTYKGQAINTRQVGRQLGVGYVLEGSVRKSGNRVRISAQLIEAETDVNLWTDRFDGSLEEVFDLQDKVAVSVAGVIEPTLQIAEVQRTSRRPTTDLTAYDLYLRALAMMLSPARRIAEIENIFDTVLERDRDFGPALALAAAFHMNCDIMGWSEDHDTNCRKGLERGRRALTLANDDPTILVNAAFALGYFGENIHAMIVLVERALSLNPSFARGWHASGCLRLWAGQPDIAIEHIETSMRLSPRTRVGWGLQLIAAAHMTCHRFNEALSVILVLIEEDPSPIAYQALIACYAHLGRLAEAREALSRMRSISSGITPPASRLVTLVPEFCKLVQSGLQLAIAES